MNTCTINNLPVYDPPLGYAGPMVNCFTMHSGAARYGIGRFLMTRADYEKLAKAADADSTPGAVTLIMKSADLTQNRDNPDPQVAANDKDQTLQLSVRLAGAAPFSPVAGFIGGDKQQDVDLVEVVLFDARSKMFFPANLAVNVQKSGFSYTGIVPDCYASTLNAGSLFTWQQVLQAKFFLGVLQFPASDLPTWKPRNLIIDQIPYGRALDDVAARLFYVVGFDYTKSGIDALQLHKPGVGLASNGKLLEKVAPHWIGGSTTERDFKQLPGKFRIVFKASDQDNPDDPYVNRAYTKDVSTSTGDDNYTQSLQVGEYVIVRKAAAWVEQATFDAVATDMASRAIRAMKAPIEEETYAGIWPFKTDGAIRGIRWISDRQGARTIVRFNNDRDFSPLDDARRATMSATNQLVTGLGGTNVSVSQSGTRMIWGGDGGGEMWVFQVNGSCNERGTYTGKGYRTNLTGVQCANDRALALPEGMTGSVDVLIINTEEQGLDPAHWLEQGGSGWGFGIRRGTDVDGWPIIVTNGGKYKRSNATLLGSGSPSDGPEEGSWSRDDDDGALNEWSVSGLRVFEGSSGNCQDDPPKLIVQMRMRSTDAGGRLYGVTTDTEFTVAEGCCPDPVSLGTSSFSPSFATVEIAQQSAIARARVASSWV